MITVPLKGLKEKTLLSHRQRVEVSCDEQVRLSTGIKHKPTPYPLPLSLPLLSATAATQTERPDNEGRVRKCKVEVY